MNPHLEDRIGNKLRDLRRQDRYNRVVEARTTRVDLICECGDVVNKDNWALHRNHEKVALG